MGMTITIIIICLTLAAPSRYLGCFEDHPIRAMPVLLSPRANLIEECHKVAAFQGYKVYGVQNLGECWSGPDAHNTYYKYGESTSCKNGLGGKWANSVYRVTCGTCAQTADLSITATQLKIAQFLSKK